MVWISNNLLSPNLIVRVLDLASCFLSKWKYKTYYLPSCSKCLTSYPALYRDWIISWGRRKLFGDKRTYMTLWTGILSRTPHSYFRGIVMEPVPWMMSGDNTTPFSWILISLEMEMYFASLMMTAFSLKLRQYAML